ncbi:MAG: radical SAM protein [Eubacteriales bacterium]|nr:radical SAM protein [Eubacteriales bacterium]
MGCMLCPRQCGADRRKQRGFCGETERIRVARAALHMWEEPCISGREGSGTIFFTGCNLRCVYCQNHTLSRSEVGKEITVMRLSEIMIELQEKGANNINLVTGSHYVPQIVEALDLAREKGLHLPIVYNCGGYESIESLRMLQGYVDIYLPDFKYWEEESGRKYSLASDYPKVAKAAVDEMVRQVGAAEFTPSGLMKKGVIVRHLLLPGKVKEAQEIVRYLHGKYGDRIYLSLMNQYTPLPSLDKEMYPELNRRVTTYEYDKLVNYAIDTGVNCAFIQEGKTAKESFIPPFTLEGV